MSFEFDPTNLWGEIRYRCSSCGNISEFITPESCEWTQRKAQLLEEDRFAERRLLENRKILPSTVCPNKDPFPYTQIGALITVSIPGIIYCRRCGSKAFEGPEDRSRLMVSDISVLDYWARGMEAPKKYSVVPASLTVNRNAI